MFEEFWRWACWSLQGLDGIDWTWLALDGVMTKAPLGGEQTGPNPTDRGKGGVKRSVLIEAHGVPLAVVVNGANRHDMKLIEATLGALMVPRPATTPDKPQGLCLDKGYDYEEVRELVAGFPGLYRPLAKSGRRAARHSRAVLPRAPLGGRTYTRLAEPVSGFVDSLGQEGRKLSRFCTSGLRHHHLAGDWPMG
jgi:putative transposase